MIQHVTLYENRLDELNSNFKKCCFGEVVAH